MEAAEKVSTEPPVVEKVETVVEPMMRDVDHGTFSTAEAAVLGAPPKDGSVVSAMTDLASLEGQALQDPDVPIEQVDCRPADDEIPSQVILEEKDEDASSAPTVVVSSTPAEVAPLVVTTTTPDVDSTVSLSAMPDPPPSLGLEASAAAPQARSVSANDFTGPSNSDGSETESYDEYIRNPEVQNAIVERSPGGRYVRFMEKLGSGASKDVYRAYDTQEGIEVAWNVVNLSGVPKTERNRIVNEVRLLERLHHHNIISFHGSWVNRERQEVNFVTEILSSGTLKSFINKVQVIRWKIAKRWATQILKGLEYLHSQDPPVIHRDLKCENIFINGTSGDLRIGDLGLSTVHRNGRVLSVLGTPEFMAPDMYEEQSYDEKVDIYAFGMCMLEIFTKEIPYSECNNPAQIYKKVSSGEPPEVLARLQSRHAREFVLLCLGYKDESGRYVRPSSSELLKHPFLGPRANDDDEVVVLPPLRERAISEAGESQTSPSGTPTSNRASSQQSQIKAVSSQSIKDSPRIPESKSPKTPTPPMGHNRVNSLDDDDDDHFEEMPQSETNMKKVKVLMGRGKELKEEARPQATVAVQPDRTSESGSPPVETVSPESVPSPEQPQQQVVAQVPTNAQHYLVAAAVIGDENLHTRPYPDDVLKLVVTLPVEGQTQNVQFDFHLVEDDPVQVAKEMVQELGIPMEAVLEISETISGLARVARMKVDKFNQAKQQGHLQSNASAHGMVQPQQMQQYPQHGQAMQQSGQQQVPQQPGVPMDGMQMAGQHVAQQPVYAQHQNVGYGNGGDGQMQLQHAPQMHGGLQQQHVQQQQTPFASQQPQQMQHAQPPETSYMPPQQQMQQAPQQQMAPAPQPEASYVPQQQIQQAPQQETSYLPQQQQQQQQQQMLQETSYAPPQQQMQPAPQQEASYAPPQQHIQLQETSYAPPQQQMQHAPQQESSYAPPQQQETSYAPPQQQMQHAPQQESSYAPPQQYIQQQETSYAQQQLQHAPQQETSYAPSQQQQHMQHASQHEPVYAPQQQMHHIVHQEVAYAPQEQMQQAQAPSMTLPPSTYSSVPVQGAPGQAEHPSVQQHHGAGQGAPQQHGYAQGLQLPPAHGLQSHGSTQSMHSLQEVMQHGVSVQSMPPIHTASDMQAHDQSSSQSLPPQPLQQPQAASVAFAHQGQESQSQQPVVTVPQAQPDGVSSGMSTQHMRHPTSPELGSMLPPRLENRSTSTGVSGGSPNTSGHLRRNPSFGGSTDYSSVSEVESEADPDMESELRKLEEDFERSMQRAKKVFDSRMDNLQRSQIEREAQHLKTLEKHEKERADFERRLAQEEEQQNRRLEQLQREWDKKRETLAQYKSRQANAMRGLQQVARNGTHSSLNDSSQEFGPLTGIPPPPGARHQRTNSTASVGTSVQSNSPGNSEQFSVQDINGGLER